jgi:hypothetical protein
MLKGVKQMTNLEKLIESYKTLSSEEIKKVLTFVEILKTQHIQGPSESHRQTGKKKHQ